MEPFARRGESRRQECANMAVFTPHSRVTGLELDKNTQESEPTPQALSDGILVVGISSKGPPDLPGVENRIRYGKALSEVYINH